MQEPVNFSDIAQLRLEERVTRALHFLEGIAWADRITCADAIRSCANGLREELRGILEESEQLRNPAHRDVCTIVRAFLSSDPSAAARADLHRDLQIALL